MKKTLTAIALGATLSLGATVGADYLMNRAEARHEQTNDTRTYDFDVGYISCARDVAGFIGFPTLCLGVGSALTGGFGYRRKE